MSSGSGSSTDFVAFRGVGWRLGELLALENLENSGESQQVGATSSNMPASIPGSADPQDMPASIPGSADPQLALVARLRALADIVTSWTLTCSAERFTTTVSDFQVQLLMSMTGGAVTDTTVDEAERHWSMMKAEFLRLQEIELGDDHDADEGWRQKEARQQGDSIVIEDAIEVVDAAEESDDGCGTTLPWSAGENLADELQQLDLFLGIEEPADSDEAPLVAAGSRNRPAAPKAKSTRLREKQKEPAAKKRRS